MSDKRTEELVAKVVAEKLAGHPRESLGYPDYDAAGTEALNWMYANHWDTLDPLFKGELHAVTEIIYWLMERYILVARNEDDDE